MALFKKIIAGPDCLNHAVFSGPAVIAEPGRFALVCEGGPRGDFGARFYASAGELYIHDTSGGVCKSAIVELHKLAVKLAPHFGCKIISVDVKRSDAPYAKIVQRLGFVEDEKYSSEDMQFFYKEVA